MTIYITIEQLPNSFQDYLNFYHERAFDKDLFIVTTKNITDILAELRLAFRKYPDYKSRLTAMSAPLKTCLLKYDR